MRVLVTGGAGFIGSHLTDAFLARGDEVIVVDDLSTGRAGRLDEHAWLHKLSITDAVSLGEIVRGTRPELICHLAAHIDVRTSVDAPAQDSQVNVVGTVNVLEAARGIGARVLFASSGGILYGSNAAIPSREDVLPLPGSPVGIAKYCAEQYIGLYNRLHGTRHSVLRLANVYGPRQDPAGEAGVIPIFCGVVLAGDDPTLYGDGSQTRDYVYVGDAVSAFLAAADAGRPGTWNIGTGVEVSVLDIVAIIGEVAGHPVGTRPGEPRAGELLRSSLAVDRAARDLDWQARTPLTDGIGRVYRWIEAGAPDRAGVSRLARGDPPEPPLARPRRHVVCCRCRVTRRLGEDTPAARLPSPASWPAWRRQPSRSVLSDVQPAPDRRKATWIASTTWAGARVISGQVKCTTS